MTFIHGYLLAGLALAGIPILLHLIMRQKPRRLPFPAFRFLRQRHRINQRKLRLQHLILLLLRIAVIAALCLALARPRIFSHRLSLGGERPVSAVLVFDTSPSMEYAVGGRSRLDEEKARARELLEEMGPDSQVAVLDTGDEGSDRLLGKAEALLRIDGLRIRPGNGPLNRTIDRAVRILEPLGEQEDAPPRFLYVFSDRTRACWEAIPAGRAVPVPAGIQSVFVDVGVESPKDLAIDKVEVAPPVVAPGGRFEVRVTVRGTGADHENVLSCWLDNDPDPDRRPDQRPVQLARGAGPEVIVFERTAPSAGAGNLDVPYQVTVKLGTRDALPFNDVRHATFVVRGSRRLLTVVDRDPKTARIWKAVHDAVGVFRCDVRTLEEVERFNPRELARYKVLCLFQVPHPPDALWKKLAAFVRDGGGLAVVPGGAELVEERDDFNKAGTTWGVLPATLLRLTDAPRNKPVNWSPFRGEHPLMAPFLKWSRTADPDFARPDLRPLVRRYWQVKPAGKDALVVASYQDKETSPALVERPVGKGRVVLFTTPLDARLLEPGKPSSPLWTNYWQDSSFGLVLVDRVCRYLAGEEEVPELNFSCGQIPQVLLPPGVEGALTLQGPGLTPSERNLKPPGEGARGRLAVPQAVTPGHYVVVDGKGRTLAGFSLNVRAEENDLARVPIEEIEAVLGKGAVLQVGRSASLREALQSSRPPPVELLPYLMVLLLLVLTVESLLANKFYRRPAPTPDEAEATSSRASS
jgi:hypothetical protein